MTYIPEHLYSMTTHELIANCRTNEDPLVTVLCEHLEYLQADLEAEIESHNETRQELRAIIADLEAEVAALYRELQNIP